MKGKFSKKLEEVLRDPNSREQLRRQLIRGVDGRIVGHDKKYDVHIGVRKSEVSPKRSGETRKK